MQSVSNGYTVVEVIIVLAITGALLISSVKFLSGAEGHNRFSQSMRDTQSKIQDWLNDIPTGFAGGTAGTAGINCMRVAVGGADRPKFGVGGGSNAGDCIFLGKAIQFTDKNSPPAAGQESQVFAYSVFGLRSYTPSGGDTRLSANLVEANPTAAVGIPAYSGGTGLPNDPTDLTEEFTIPGGAKVKRIVTSSGIAGNQSHLAGFYLSFNQLSATSSGSASLRAYQYPISGNHLPGNIQTSAAYKDIDECISLRVNGTIDCSPTSVSPAAAADSWPKSLSDWEICFDNDTNGDTAILTIQSVNGLNVTTKLEFTSC